MPKVYWLTDEELERLLWLSRECGIAPREADRTEGPLVLLRQIRHVPDPVTAGLFLQHIRSLLLPWSRTDPYLVQELDELGNRIQQEKDHAGNAAV